MVLYFDHIDSTNHMARQKALEGAPHGLVVRAARQSAGRGQYDRSFASPSGGLYFSLLLRPDMPMAQLPLITLAVGVACREVLYERFKVEAKIKWPNDLYLGDRKAAGILCESVLDAIGPYLRPAVIAGVGMNVNSTLADFPVGLQPLVTTLFEQTGQRTGLDSLLEDMVQAIEEKVLLLAKDTHLLLSQWQDYDYLLNKPLVYTAGESTVHGIGLGVSALGQYRFRDDRGKERSVVGGQLRPNQTAAG
jgi:BirA family biotin operon repressor/biotin-[acetyl-CoA-carboxylase] ligase